MMKRLLILCVACLFVPTMVNAALVAKEDFDGGAVGLTSSSVTNLDGGGGDWFGVGNRNAWPQGLTTVGVPFGLGDDTVISYSNPNNAPFPTDNEAIFGQNSDLDNDYFALSDTREWTAGQLTASWTFNIHGYVDMSVLIDMGGISSTSSSGYALDTDLKFTASIDASPPQTLFDANAITNPGFVTRPMDDGDVSGGGRLLEVVGDGPVTKLLAENGAVAANTYFDKTPASGAGAGKMDTFKTALVGSGDVLVITMTTSVPFEAAAFDNIVIEGDVSTVTKPTSWGELKSKYRR